MCGIRLFTPAVAKAKQVVANPDEPADPHGGGFVNWAILTLHRLRIEHGKYYRAILGLLSEMSDILGEIGLTRGSLHTVLPNWSETIPTFHDEHETRRSYWPAGRRRTAGDLRSLAASRGYDVKAFRDELSEYGVRPLTKHCIYSLLDQAHNACIDGDSYNKRWVTETVFSSIKHTLGAAVRACSWHLEFREIYP